MDLDPNKSYYIVDFHTGKGLGYEVYASYDYVREVDGHGSSFNFEFEGDEYSSTCKIRLNGGHWSDYKYLTLSGKGWVYLDNKENATIWLLEDNFGAGLLKLTEAGLKREERHLGYIEKGDKKWLAGKDFERRKGFKLVSAD
ncbi:hypothetical protein P4678_29150 [Priestia megaterium]|uniref:hypothetical protein n=1 Tax=Priestia megaterium TaxID=1404 RepID=UPI002E1B9D51|nr:hypothetical protein [Priestia megaterium]MED4298658.1 hypothetical protein [Priestia megaterium]